MDINSAKKIDKNFHDYDTLIQELLTPSPTPVDNDEDIGTTSGQNDLDNNGLNDLDNGQNDLNGVGPSESHDNSITNDPATTDNNNLNDNETKEPEKPKEPTRPVKWRHMTDIDFEDLIILSYGEEFPSSVSVVNKSHDNTIDDKDLPMLARKELDIIQEKAAKDDGAILKYIATDFPRAQFSKDYYLDRIKVFLRDNKTDGAAIWYSGVSEHGSGNWCFKDGTISFEEIFGLYMDHFRGKRLTIITDCSYSGQWVVDAAKKMDEIGIPSCGHYTRKEGILLKIFASCQPNGEAYVLAFAEGIQFNNGKMNFPLGENMVLGQTPYYGDFRAIRCRKLDTEACEIGLTCTWQDRVIHGSKYLYLVRGKDRGDPAWHYVLVDKDKVEDFKLKVSTGNIDVAKYGKVIASGWGKDPPKEKKEMVDRRYMDYIPPN